MVTAVLGMGIKKTHKLAPGLQDHDIFVDEKITFVEIKPLENRNQNSAVQVLAA